MLYASTRPPCIIVPVPAPILVLVVVVVVVLVSCQAAGIVISKSESKPVAAWRAYLLLREDVSLNIAWNSCYNIDRKQINVFNKSS